MSLIDNTYFVREIALPEGKYKAIQVFITRYEPKVIYDLFGYELGKLIIVYDSGTSPQRIKDIVEGKEYTISETNRYKPGGGDSAIKWNGLINEEKVSLLAYWIFYWWCRENESFATNVGGAKSKLENAVNIGFNEKTTFAWREMIQLYGFFNQPEIEPSCFNFMNEFQTTYPEWVFKSKKSINRLGI